MSSQSANQSGNTPMQFQVTCIGFHEMNAADVYAMLRLRSEVFVVEQNCVFLDADNKDQECDHVLIRSGEKLVSCSRLVPPGLIYDEMSIGRVVTHPSVRGTGVGKLLMEKSLDFLYQKFGNGPVKIGAQYYLKTFYESFGFVRCGEIYDEDGIDHIHMLKV